METVAHIMKAEGCYRQHLVAHFDGAQPRCRDLSIRTLEFFFSKRVKTERSPYCCDVCDAHWTGPKKAPRKKRGKPDDIVQEEAKLVHLAAMLVGREAADTLARTFEAKANASS